MTKQELILKGKHKVRNTPSLLLIYIDLYFEQFGYKPTCAGCSFNSDWQKFVSGSAGRYVRKDVAPSMPVTFRLKNKGNEILSFFANGTTHRKYSNKISEEFAINFLTYGTEEQIRQRKELFAVLPDKFK